MAQPYDLRKFLNANSKGYTPAPHKNVPILGINRPLVETVKIIEAPQQVHAPQQQAPASVQQTIVDSAEATVPQAEVVVQTNNAVAKDAYVAAAMHDLVLSCGWAATRTTPESNYYFYTYVPPAHKRNWMQARVYITKLNLNRIITVEGLTIQAGVQDRLTIVIRMQKSGGVGQLANSKTVTQTLDTGNYFSQNNQLVNPDGLRAVLSSYLKQAEMF